MSKARVPCLAQRALGPSAPVDGIPCLPSAGAPRWPLLQNEHGHDHPGSSSTCSKAHSDNARSQCNGTKSCQKCSIPQTWESPAASMQETTEQRDLHPASLRLGENAILANQQIHPADVATRSILTPDPASLRCPNRTSCQDLKIIGRVPAAIPTVARDESLPPAGAPAPSVRAASVVCAAPPVRATSSFDGVTCCPARANVRAARSRHMKSELSVHVARTTTTST